MTAVPAAVTAVTARAGKKQFAEAGGRAPEQTSDSVKADVADIKERAHR